MAIAFELIPALLMVAIMTFMPCSPRWLATQGRDSEALAILAKIRCETVDDLGTQMEYRYISDSVADELKIGNGKWTELFVPGLRNRLAIAIMIQFWQQFSGVNAILYFQGSLITGMGFSKEMAQVPFTIANDFVNFAAAFPAMYLVDTLGRRKLLLVGGLGMATAHFMVTAFIGMSKSTGADGFGWGAIVSIYVFFLFFASTWGFIKFNV
jgi:hypothetical protein